MHFKNEENRTNGKGKKEVKRERGVRRSSRKREGARGISMNRKKIDELSDALNIWNIIFIC